MYLVHIIFNQFGNTCYANSVLQALYFCRPFREKVLAYAYKQEQQAEGKDKGGDSETLLSVLGDLFVQIATYKKKFGVIHPKKFITKVKKENGEFCFTCVLSDFILSLPIISYFQQHATARRS